jgi:hypothetical protein
VDAALPVAVSPRRLVAFLPGGFAASALLPASLGIYAMVSVLSHPADAREIGVRMALRASASNVQWGVVRLAFGGIAVGIAGRLGPSQLLSSLLQRGAPRVSTRINPIPCGQNKYSIRCNICLRSRSTCKTR